MSFENGGVSPALAGREAYRPILAPKTASQYRRYASACFLDLQRRMQTLPGHVTLSIDPPKDFVGYNEVILRMGELVLTLGCIEACRGYDLHFRAGDEYIINIPFRGNGWASTGATFIEYG